MSRERNSNNTNQQGRMIGNALQAVEVG